MSIKKDILKLAIPSIISNISVPLLGIIDLALVGHLGSDIYIGAIALGSTIFSFLYWGFGFLRMGTGGITAQAYGRKSDADIRTVLFQGLIIAAACSLALLILQKPISNFSFYLIEGSNEVEHFARQYFMIRIWAAPATISMYVFAGWFIGMQNTRIPMITSIFVNIINIVLNYIFVWVLDMKTSGVALGTVIAQYLALFLYIWYLYKNYNRFTLWPGKKDILNKAKIKELFNVNKDIFIRTMFLIFVLSFFTAKSAAANDRILAINTLLFQFFFIFSFFSDGFANAAESLSGKFMGAKNRDNLIKSVKLTFSFGLYITAAFTLIYYLFAENILYLLTDNNQMIIDSRPYILWIVLIPVLSIASFIWDGVFLGITESKALRNSVLVSSILIFFPIYFMTKGSMGNHGLWLAFSLFMLTRSLLLTLYASKSKVLRT